MHWLTIVGILLIATGTVFTYLGQTKTSQKDINILREQINNKDSRIDTLLVGNDRLSKQIEEYQHTVEQKDNRISELENNVNKLNTTAPQLLLDGRIAPSPGIMYASEYSDGISTARDEFNKGNLDNAYKIVKKLYNKNKKFGLAQFLMGTIEISRQNFTEGELLLKNSINLGLPKTDLDWAYHNLGISLLRQQKYIEAISYFEEALKVNPNKKESSELLISIKKYLDEQQ